MGNRFAAFIFGKGIGSQGAVIAVPEGDDVVVDESNAEYYRKIAEPLQFTPNITIEKALPLLSHQIGNYIIYNYIQSMNLDNYSSILSSQYRKGIGKHKHRIDNTLKDEKERHMLSDTWIRSTITSHIHRFKNKFRHVLGRYGYVPDLQTPEGRKKRITLGDYLLDKEAIKELLSALDKSCLDMHKLERYRNELINSRENIEWYQDRMNYLKTKHKNKNENKNKK